MELSVPEGIRGGDVLEVDSEWEAPVLAMRLLFESQHSNVDEALSFRLGTTKGTNALLEKKGAPTALFLSKGFEDLLLIRDQKRPELFSRKIDKPLPLYHRVVEISGRLDTHGNELEPLDLEALRKAANRALQDGCEVAAICFLNSWKNPCHELAAEGILSECGFKTVCCSSSIRPLIKYLDRTETTLVNATLSPVMDSYLDRVQGEIGDNRLWVMTSAGGLVSRARFHAVDSLVSGPAGGVLGAVEAGKRAGLSRIIGLDMGGTSTDVSRWKNNLELRQQIQVGEARILTPALPIETVAAGGGSICGFKDSTLFVGPESAGANPGPACYGAGGPLTLTDVHLLLGRMDPDGFSIPIRFDLAKQAMQAVADEAGEKDWRTLAEGFLTVATERTAQAIRQISLREGEDPAAYGLVAFGGAGGLHACRVAELLGIKQIIFPPDAGILSARGIHTAPRESVIERQVIQAFEEGEPCLESHFSEMQLEATGHLQKDGVDRDDLSPRSCSVFIRLQGQEASIPVQWESGSDVGRVFRDKFIAIFGYFPKGAQLEIVKLRLRLLERSEKTVTEKFEEQRVPSNPERSVEGFLEGEEVRIPVHERILLHPGNVIAGPAIIRDPYGTAFVESGWKGIAGTEGSVQILPVEGKLAQPQFARSAKVERTLVLNRIAGMLEEMGDQLQRTALSTNIRERLDFSCALLDEKGRLLANAPHIPVHLGAMGLCVRECLKQYTFTPGDVLVTNHPGAGGSHLPDVTLICGLFDAEERLMGYLANRAHHAEIGGRSPGSMPADARTLEEEGVLIPPQWLIHKDSDRFDLIEQLLSTARYPTRSIRENRIDLEAQLASLQRGRDLFNDILRDFSAGKVSAHFNELFGFGVSAMKRYIESCDLSSSHVVETMDDGHEISVTIEHRSGIMEIDFDGTSTTHPGNLNATPAIVRSAVLYVLRLLVNEPIPLNEGLLEGVRIKLPDCFLNPLFSDDARACPAVVGGNVETSQRMVDALVRAFGLMASGQGTMNNLLFGNEQFGYYETIGGGAGAGECFDGASGVHVHMTNTAITDPEILENRFPVYCREFSLRKGSGGTGIFSGGDGLVRELHFLENVSVSLLSQNRNQGPRGLHGGADGLPGQQWIVSRDGIKKRIEGHAQVSLEAGEGIRVETPGGGGWGRRG
nr:hydantoinase B/oxoprolinase family protein [Oceanipulchritudo coccoides]